MSESFTQASAQQHNNKGAKGHFVSAPINLFLSPVVGGAAADSSRQLLGGLSGLASPGELVAIMGASGSGKSVLLKTLGRRMPLEGGLRESGAVSFNGAPLDVAEHSRRVAFLDQEDHFIAEVGLFFTQGQAHFNSPKHTCFGVCALCCAASLHTRAL